ncbi:SspB family protein [Methylovirgula sp. 4M-Z18]|uniref:SspB family protein n=1 Tax=Methylovirgula sp. 4M-Z18 TaxID=2293567 RepID=UPI000E2FB668|nr:ClpXP protease specificity-enhancing factor SspB [Methylovirgula sp. 4M-Z18]RFB79580.1 Stringent starvation protein B [Methylovirgula sp. 4M-Z18]
MVTDHIRYDLLVQEALRSVVKRVLETVERNGLPGEHHCFISFRTDAPGVQMSPALRQRFPREMSIILQHQFFGLKVGDTAFDVGLHFGGIPERLHIPFDAIMQYGDPSVGFQLSFPSDEDDEEEMLAAEETETGDDEMSPAPAPVKLAETPPPAPRGAASEPTLLPAKAAPAKPNRAPREPAPRDEAPADAKVVSIDAFRKK